MSTHSFSLPDLSCGHCVATVTKELAQVPTLSACRVDLAGRRVSFTLGDESHLTTALTRLEQAGYPAATA